MKELLITAPPRPKMALPVHRLHGKSLKGWRATTAAWAGLRGRGSLPEVTMVEMNTTASGAGLLKFIKELAAKQEGTPTPSYIVLCFVGPERPAAAKVADLLRGFHRPEQVEVRWTAKSPNADGVLVEIEPKLELLREIAAAKPPRPSPMDRLEKVLASTRDLRLANGSLSAQRVADVFGASLSELAAWLGRSRQAVNKTPDAESLQSPLAFFERVARLRLRLSDADFRKWLRMPNALLEGLRPIDLLAASRGQVLADFVDDMLTGSPT